MAPPMQAGSAVRATDDADSTLLEAGLLKSSYAAVLQARERPCSCLHQQLWARFIAIP